MGSSRNNHRTHPRQARRAANREWREAIKAPKPVPFGIRRELTQASAAPLMRLFQLIIDDDDILRETIVHRPSLHNTILPRQRISDQLKRGIVAGVEFERRSRSRLEEAFGGVLRDQGRISAMVGKPTILKNNIFALTLHGEELEAQHNDAAIMMADLGLKGAMKERPPIHVSLGDGVEKYIGKVSQDLLLERLTDPNLQGQEVQLEQTEVYPRPAQPQSGD